MAARPHVAILLSTRYFEDFYGDELGLSRAEYLESYRNDWSWDWCEMFSQEGLTTSLLVPTIGGPERVATAEGVTVRFLELGRISSPWVRFPVLERSPIGRYVGQVANVAGFLRPLRAAITSDEIDVLCVQEYWTARFDVLARALEIPVVAVDQGLPDRHEIKVLKRAAFSRCAGVITQTRSEAEKVGRYGGRSERIPNAVDAQYFCPADGGQRGPESPTILSVGRIEDAQKRLSDLVRAMSQLPPDWRLQIAGTGPDQGKLESLAASLGVDQRIRFLGFVGSVTALRDLYRQASVLAIPSAYEGLPMVLLESMSCGTPVVGSDIPAIAEVIEHGRSGVLTPVGDPERLAGALREAVARRQELGAAARATILRDYDQLVVSSRLAAFVAAQAA